MTGSYCHSYDYYLTQQSGFPVFQTYVSANYVRKKKGAQADRRHILDLAADPTIGILIIQSLASEHIKMALAMTLFGAVPKNVDDKHSIRIDVNALILGDPGTAKSCEFLAYATLPTRIFAIRIAEERLDENDSCNRL